MNKEYREGRTARARGLGKYACPYGLAFMFCRSWWLAGWHDVDAENGDKKYHG